MSVIKMLETEFDDIYRVTSSNVRYGMFVSKRTLCLKGTLPLSAYNGNGYHPFFSTSLEYKYLYSFYFKLLGFYTRNASGVYSTSNYTSANLFNSVVMTPSTSGKATTQRMLLGDKSEMEANEIYYGSTTYEITNKEKMIWKVSDWITGDVNKSQIPPSYFGISPSWYELVPRQGDDKDLLYLSMGNFVKYSSAKGGTSNPYKSIFDALDGPFIDGNNHVINSQRGFDSIEVDIHFPDVNGFQWLDSPQLNVLPVIGTTEIFKPIMYETGHNAIHVICVIGVNKV